MTAQLVVMNAGGIALASDSAMTINEKKVCNSANKLFSFSEGHSIGVMAYGTASMFHVPWETLIEVYKNKLEDPFDTVNEYTEDFLQFLNQNEFNEFMADSNEEIYIENSLDSIVLKLYNDLADMKTSLYTEEYKASPQGVFQEVYLQHAEDFLDSSIQHINEKSFPVGFSNHDYEILFDKYAEKVPQIVYRTFLFHIFRMEWLDKIIHFVIASLIKEFSNEFSGIIFSGYGNKEIFPSMHLLIIDGKLNNKTKYYVKKKAINQSTPGTILPFAERDMTKSFLDGIHEEMESFIATFLKKEFNTLSATLIDQLKDDLKAESDLDVLENGMSNALMNVYEKYQKEILHFKRENFSAPILEVVESLPAKELAYLSESLLGATALKKKMSVSIETVSAPIDTAVITKGEGFKWIKKK